MRWAKTSLRNSFFGWMGKDSAPELEARTEEIRRAMLHALEQGPGGGKSALERKLLFARSTEELWYARPDLMNALAASQGEAVARDLMEKITDLFDKRLPRGRR